MSIQEYQYVVFGWAIILVFLTIFWYVTLRRLSDILKERLSATRSHQSISGLQDMFLFILRGEFKRTGDERLTGVCGRLRKLLYGYLGSIAAYIVFLVIYRPHI